MLYTYKCDDCNEEFEVERYINDDLSQMSCPNCGKIAKRVYKTTYYKRDCKGFFDKSK